MQDVDTVVKRRVRSEAPWAKPQVQAQQIRVQSEAVLLYRESACDVEE